MTKRYGIRADQFEALPWHYRRMYLELLAEEIELEREQQGGGRTERVDASGDISSFFNVTRV